MLSEHDRTAAIAIFEDGWNRGHFADLVRVCAPTFTFHVHGASRTTDVAELEAIVAAWRRGFPDLRFDLHHVIAEGGLVVVHATLTGTHRGEWRGHLPTGNEIAVDHAFVLRFERGRMVEVWEVLDSEVLRQQLEGASDPA